MFHPCDTTISSSLHIQNNNFTSPWKHRTEFAVRCGMGVEMTTLFCFIVGTLRPQITLQLKTQNNLAKIKTAS